jgi:hypothetical protein
MAITKDKLLPPSKSTVSMNFRPKTKKINTSKLLSPVEDKNEDNDNNILNSIGKKVLRIRDIFASTTLFKKKQTEKNRIQKEEETSDKNEKKLENKQKDKDNKFKVPSIPGLGFLGFLKNFIFKTLIGYFVYNLIPHLPKLIGFIKLATPVFNFLIDWGGKALDRLLTFIDWGYKAIDKTEKFIKDIGGDGALKMFKKFEGAFTAFINGALIFGMLATGKGKGPGGGRGGGPGRGGRGLSETREARRGVSRVDTARGINYRKNRTTGYTRGSGDALSDARIEKLDKAGKLTFDGKSTTDIAFQRRKGGTDVMKKYVDKFGRDAAVRRFGQESVEGLGGKYARSGLTNLARKGFSMAPQRAVIKFLKKGPAKFLTKGLGRVPVIGGLIDFAINLAMGEEPIGRAAAKAVGSTAGAALGTLIPIPFAGTILGGYLGDIAGGMLYDSLTGGKKQNAAGGGQITRGGKPTSGPIKRTLKKPRRTLNVKSTPVKPGASIGGKKNISKIFPENRDNKSINPLGYMEKSSKTMSEVPYLGPLFGLATKTILGQKPDKTDYMNAGNGLSNWISLASSNEITRGGTAFASGGPVTVAPMLGGGDITKWLQNSVENLVVPKIDDIINDLMKEMGLKKAEDIKTTPSSSPSQPGVEGAADFSGSSGAEKTMHYLISQGLTGEQAAGIAGNLQQEGGFDPAAKNTEAGLHIGIAQWDSVDRWPKVSAYISSKGMDPNTLEGQLVGLKWEAQQRGQWQKIKNAKSLQEASDIWLKEFEIPGDYATESPHRAALGNQLFAKYGNYRPPAGTVPSGPLGTLPGNLSAAQQLASSMGLTMTSFNTGKHADGSLHYQNRAMDFSNDSVGNGTPQQLALAKELIKRYGSTAKEIFYTPLGFSIKDGQKVPPIAASSHYNHVHVAFAKGGRVSKPTYAMIGEKGEEFIFDADTTRGLDSLTPNLLDHLNAAKTKPQLMGVLQSYAGYENMGMQDIIVELPEPELIPVPVPMNRGTSGFIGGSNSDPYESLALIG